MDAWDSLKKMLGLEDDGLQPGEPLDAHGPGKADFTPGGVVGKEFSIGRDGTVSFYRDSFGPGGTEDISDAQRSGELRPEDVQLYADDHGFSAQDKSRLGLSGSYIDNMMNKPYIQMHAAPSPYGSPDAEHDAIKRLIANLK